MKFCFLTLSRANFGRSRKGAWIEISDVYPYDRVIIVAPVRERGLKYRNTSARLPTSRRSRKGAWIEISALANKTVGQAASLP